MLRVEQVACRLPSALSVVISSLGLRGVEHSRLTIRRRRIHSFGARRVVAQTAWAAPRVPSSSVRAHAREKVSMG